MKLSQEIRMKYLTGFVSGCLFGIGIMSLSLINLLSGYISGEQILSIYYLGFAAIGAGIVSALFSLSSVHKTVERVEDGQTSVE